MSESWEQYDDRGRCIVCESGKDGICSDCAERGYDIYQCGCVTLDGKKNIYCATHDVEEAQLEAWWDYGRHI